MTAMTKDQVVATAVSVKRTVMVEVSENGFVSGVRLLSSAVKRWGDWDFGDRLVAVADVAHDRYCANRPNLGGGLSQPTLAEVAAAERRLMF